MTILVYPVGHGRGDLLRYSLRSVHYASDGGDLPRIVLIGDVPDYIDRTAAEVVFSSQAHSPFVNVWAAWRRAAALLGGEDPAAEWWWMNDDFYVTAPRLETALVDGHRGPLEPFVRALEGRAHVGAYRARARVALGLLRACGYLHPMCWEAHRPLRVNGAAFDRARKLMETWGMDPTGLAVRTVVATVAGYEGQAMPDPKTDERGPGPIADPLASVGPRAWAGPIGEAIRGWFPDPSPWERV